jgi:hypothetical protein
MHIVTLLYLRSITAPTDLVAKENFSLSSTILKKKEHALAVRCERACCRLTCEISCKLEAKHRRMLVYVGITMALEKGGEKRRSGPELVADGIELNLVFPKQDACVANLERKCYSFAV